MLRPGPCCKCWKQKQKDAAQTVFPLLFQMEHSPDDKPRESDAPKVIACAGCPEENLTKCRHTDPEQHPDDCCHPSWLPAPLFSQESFCRPGKENCYHTVQHSKEPSGKHQNQTQPAVCKHPGVQKSPVPGHGDPDLPQAADACVGRIAKGIIIVIRNQRRPKTE